MARRRHVSVILSSKCWTKTCLIDDWLASWLLAGSAWLGEAPFHGDLIDNDINKWLRNLALGSSPQCDVLVMLLQRIFSILVNSMPDERTNSTITWLNTALHGN
ncbi:hypothetical protein GGX14DRAFT_561506 [Mycena pura]|uniref:Uncharacterized protein n=1 Tax=Mycena pura TaxID=153505 RepID=A0AAD6VLS4_9AGAR|nr:hypothetical protein GGX14DRAFT_561506 [Mycena pura]